MAIVAGLSLFPLYAAWRTSSAFPPSGEFITMAGTRAHFTDTGGAGRWVVLLHSNVAAAGQTR